MNFKIHSFDVFDTVLMRPVADPCALFFLLGREISEGGEMFSAGRFMEARNWAGVKAYQKVGEGGATLEQIYEELRVILDVSELTAKRWREKELQLESELICAVPGAVERLTEARKNGKVCFLSDTYFPALFIERLLQKNGLWIMGEAVYASCEEKADKASGELFKKMMTKENVLAREVFHVGNHYDFDLKGAEKAGIQAALFKEANANKYESSLELHRAVTGGGASFLAGSSRMARLSVKVSSEKEKIIRDTAAGVAAPLLVSYVFWVLQKAKELKLERLYFVSRDGQILLALAEKIAKKTDFKAEMRYLFGGRQAWHLPGIFTVAEEELAWMFYAPRFFSLNSFFSRISTSMEEVEEILKSNGFEPAGWNENMAASDREKLKRLVRSGVFNEMILKKARQAREGVLNYFKQEKVLDKGAWGLVDIGWHGNLQNSLGKILSQNEMTVPHGFYFGLRKEAAADRFGKKHAFFYNLQEKTKWISFAEDMTPWLDLFARGDHGVVLGYENGPAGVRALLKENQNLESLDSELPVFWKTIHAFADYFLSCSRFFKSYGDLRPALAAAFEQLCFHPSMEEAGVWGRFKFDGDPLDMGGHAMAEPYGVKEALVYLFSGKLNKGREDNTWSAGALLLTDLKVQKLIDFFSFFRRNFLVRPKRRVSYVLKYLKACKEQRKKGPEFDFKKIPLGEIKIQKEDILLFSVVRNESLRLPFFIDYYRGMGVNKFFFIDNNSDDSTRDILTQYNRGDFKVFSTADHYADFHCGHDWLVYLLNHYGRGHWCVIADSDEILIYPHYEQLNLHDLKKYLESRKVFHLQSFLLDMYSDKPIRGTLCHPGQHPLEVCPYFDGKKPEYANTYVDSLTGDKYDFVKGGMRKRVFNTAPYLTKNIFVKYSRCTILEMGCHTIRNSKKADIEGVVLHFKYYSDFINRSIDVAKTGNHWSGGAEYKNYAHSVISENDLTAFYPGSIKFKDSRQLVNLGFMKTSNAFEKFSAGQKTCQI